MMRTESMDGLIKEKIIRAHGSVKLHFIPVPGHFYYAKGFKKIYYIHLDARLQDVLMDADFIISRCCIFASGLILISLCKTMKSVYFFYHHDQDKHVNSA